MFFLYQTHIETIKTIADLVCDSTGPLYENLLDVLIEETVENWVGAGGGHPDEVTNHVGGHEALWGK